MPPKRAFPPRDPAAALRASRSFCRAHGLSEWAAALPRGVRTRLPQTTGLDAGLVFPPVPVQLATITLLFETLATRPVRRLDPAEQYGEPLIDDLRFLRQCEARHRPVGPYLLLFRSRGVHAGSVGAAPTAIEQDFHDRGWTGLTLPEYLVLQRLAVEAWRDHRFDAPESRSGSQRQWLLDAVAGGSCCAVEWAPGMRRLEVRFASPDRGEPGRGAHPAVVVPL